MGPDCIDHRGLLTNEQMAGAVEHQTALLLGVLVGTKRTDATFDFCNSINPRPDIADQARNMGFVPPE